MKPTRMTRRQLAGAVLSTAAAAAQTPAAAQAPAPAPSTPDGELQAARERNQRTSETLAAAWAKVKVPMETEPAFHFTA
jgi:hypothetical protein